MSTAELKKLISGLKENISLKDYTTFHIGGTARFFYIAKTEKDLVSALKTVGQADIPFFILGGGSNLLVSDNGFNGIVIKLEIKGAELQLNGSVVMAGAGGTLGSVVNFAVKHGLKDMEWAIGIPGTLGGAVRGNASAFGKAMDHIVKSVRVFDCSSFEIKEFSNKECGFDSKKSIFKKNKNLVILSIKIMLEKGVGEEIKEKMAGYKKFRMDNHPISFPSAGCIFKNYESEIIKQELLNQFPKLREFNKKGIIPAGYLIDMCGIRGETKGDAKISEKHANFIINTGDARAEDVVWLIKLAKRKVKEKFGVELEEEIQYLGAFDY